MNQISPIELKAWLDDAKRDKPVLLDVREPEEFAHCHIEHSASIPMGSVPARLQEFDPDRETVVICHHGMRSMQTAIYLRQQGFSKIYNLSGGVAAWAVDVDPSMPTY